MESTRNKRTSIKEQFYEKLESDDNENVEVKKDLENTNKYKVRVIEAEINSGLYFQTLIYYNFYAAIVIFLFEIATTSFKVSFLS